MRLVSLHFRPWLPRLALATSTLAVAMLHAGCGDGSATGTGGSTTSGTAGSGGTGATGGSTTATGGSNSTSSAGGTGGTASTGGSGGSGATGPFDSSGISNFETDGTVATNADGDMVVAWNAFLIADKSAVGYSVSHDNGNSWTAPKYLYSPDGLYAANPVVVSDGQKRFTIGWAAFGTDPDNPKEHVYVSRLAPGASEFGAPGLASDDGTSTTRDFDKPWFAVDANDNLLATWADFTGYGMGNPPSLTFARSVDGVTFERTTVTADATFGNLAYPCLDRDLGPAAPIYMVHLAVGATLLLRKSTDQGQNWQSFPVPAADVVFQDPTCVAHGSDVWISYGAGMAVFNPGENPPADTVFVVHSGNGGQTFDAPVAVTPAGAGNQYLFPQLARSGTGELAVAYYQGVVDGPNELMLATSETGATWSVSTLADAGTFTLDRTQSDWLGDYIGISRAGDGLMVAYADNTGGKAHVKLASVQP